MVKQRIALGIEYNGSAFNGYQLQSIGTRTVQGELEKALSKVADEPVRLTCAGRTDTGVHATGQVVHFDTAVPRELKAWMLGGNTNLPRDISIHWVRKVNDDFSARFSAISRSYRYILLNRKVRSAIFQHNVSWSFELLDEKVMNTAAQMLVGKHDFSAFRSSQCQAKHAVREMQNIAVIREGDYVILDIKANAFLHHMVRNIMGTLMVIGRGEQPVEWIQQVLSGLDRKKAGMTAQAAGLYLINVEYPAEHGLPDSGWLPKIS
ncbi:MAG: tRNA pseudouridine(38-40) synthase TruA [Gammaproteobacteria bacterium]|nr:MAG: tRNA pseudouridine(38-40) synthase TruA [Gammaproteobacteria bacterium]